MYHKCKYTKKEIIQTNNLQKFEKIQRNILKPAGVAAVGVVFLAEVAMKATFFADNLYHHNSYED